ncbi:hypothetical protein OHB35_09885 [Streptomyces phaeochromogenes]|uniref:Translation initiation factor 2 n=1 Tax=Streptomyces phaeochromogenes TaxID=1923 RepID=A0ABZ1H835_STRPH|nr:hypothetical protein [Streptomyces phaeochromogenes]WSD13521.1 hypothetical protein OHB35_09885 [Streptomyces phaeochromogenes]
MDAGQDGWIRVPVGDDAARWATRADSRPVLLVVHNVTAATRLLDVLPLFHDDLRVQLLATTPGSSAFRAGLAELFAKVDVPVVPWEQAVRLPVQLAISASFGGQLAALPCQLTILSHGVGYTKKLATPRSRDTGEPGSAPVFGLSREWLLGEDGAPVADALVLSHPEQLERLRAACPEAVHTAVLAGDPCFDRVLAARGHRERYRRTLGTHPGQRLVLLNSTWHTESLFGDGGDDLLPALLPRLTSELPADEYRVAAVLHPNIWYGHGPGQIRIWLDRARRAGLTLVDPLDGWRQALLAADVVIGDHGSVTYYAAALGTPVLLGAAPLAALDPDAPISDFVRETPRLDPTAPLRPQLDTLLSEHQPRPGPAEFTTSHPGESAARLRRLFYAQLGLPEPDEPALLEPLPLPRYEPPSRTAPLRVLTWLRGSGEVAVERYADPRSEPPGDGEVHLAVHEDTRDPAQLAIADVVFGEGSATDPRFGSPARWTAETLLRHPHSALAAYVTSPDACTVRTRDGQLLRLTADSAESAEPTADPAMYASALHAWLAAGKSVEELMPEGLTVRTGAAVHSVQVTSVRVTPA